MESLSNISDPPKLKDAVFAFWLFWDSFNLYIAKSLCKALCKFKAFCIAPSVKISVYGTLTFSYDFSSFSSAWNWKSGLRFSTSSSLRLAKTSQILFWDLQVLYLSPSYHLLQASQRKFYPFRVKHYQTSSFFFSISSPYFSTSKKLLDWQTLQTFKVALHYTLNWWRWWSCTGLWVHRRTWDPIRKRLCLIKVRPLEWLEER